MIEYRGFLISAVRLGGLEKILFYAEKNGKYWEEWFDERMRRVECIDTARPLSMTQITEKEDAGLEIFINKKIHEIEDGFLNANGKKPSRTELKNEILDFFKGAKR